MDRAAASGGPAAPALRRPSPRSPRPRPPRPTLRWPLRLRPRGSRRSSCFRRKRRRLRPVRRPRRRSVPRLPPRIPRRVRSPPRPRRQVRDRRSNGVRFAQMRPDRRSPWRAPRDRSPPWPRSTAATNRPFGALRAAVSCRRAFRGQAMRLHRRSAPIHGRRPGRSPGRGTAPRARRRDSRRRRSCAARQAPRSAPVRSNRILRGTWRRRAADARGFCRRDVANEAPSNRPRRAQWRPRRPAARARARAAALRRHEAPAPRGRTSRSIQAGARSRASPPPSLGGRHRPARRSVSPSCLRDRPRPYIRRGLPPIVGANSTPKQR